MKVHLASVTFLVATAAAAYCVDDDCARAVTAFSGKSKWSASRKSDCSSLLKYTLHPPAKTITVTGRHRCTSTITTTLGIGRRTTTVIVPMQPVTYAPPYAQPSVLSTQTPEPATATRTVTSTVTEINSVRATSTVTSTSVLATTSVTTSTQQGSTTTVYFSDVQKRTPGHRS
ncbi:hypothetical protein Slin15195_G026310 [Septoria linicola]|uniref:Uncharacterized protein n=1 Tax=Septoria linicola TaxID=215465 RepID=A0A9Q9AHI6_9PEZI|nr:hypothetical protein Slin14017_G025370 [Septoria linicola]USW49312.1 hypothetical protein Slin15195_G026310 [Septoria linicola]